MTDPQRRPERTLDTYAPQSAPRVERRRTIELGHRTVGYLGREVERGRTVYVSEREKGKHRYYGRDKRYDLPFSGQGYGLSMEVFSRIHGADGRVVYIVETDTGDVYEFAFSQFVDGAPVNVDDDGRAAHPERGYEKDPQKVVPVDAAVHVYEGHAPRFWAPVTGY